MTSRRLRRQGALVAACGIALTVLPYAPAHAADDRPVVLTLRSRAAKARVLGYLKRHGYTVTGSTAETVAARGPATAGLRGALGADVTSVGGLGTQHRWAHHVVPAGYTGADLAAAYDVPNGTGSGLTVATVQFSGWRPTDLSTYASAAGLAVPNVTQVAVNGANPADTSSGGDIEVALDQEVLLATAPAAKQRIYFGHNTNVDAVSVYAKIADDAEAGLIDVVSTSWGMCEPWMDEDPGSRSAIETALGRIVAAGATVFAASGDMGVYDCSDPDFPDNTMAVDYPAASAKVVAVGGTSLTNPNGAWTETAWGQLLGGGDFHGYGGGGGESTSVPLPSWQVSAITPAGPHRLVPDVSAMAAPSNGFGLYAASAGGWVVGGGTSAAAPLVAGQLAATLSSGGRTTGVGDIHPLLYANPTAFRDITHGSNLGYVAEPGYDMATGLGSPRWSALGSVFFGNPVVAVPAATRSTAVPLTVTPVSGMTVTAWTVGEGETVACDAGGSATVPTSYDLTPGDRATRIAVGALDDHGACHVGSAPVTLDTAAPSATGSIGALTWDGKSMMRWTLSDPAPSSGPGTYDVCLYRVGTGCVWTINDTLFGSHYQPLAPGYTYQLRVTATDAVGNVGTMKVVATYVAPVDSASFGHTPSWTTNGSTSDWYGSHLYSAHKGAYAQKTITGTKYEVFYVACPTCGYFDVYIGGYLARRVNAYSATKQYKRVVLGASYATRKARTVKIVVRGTHDSRSKGSAVAFDAVRVAY